MAVKASPSGHPPVPGEAPRPRPTLDSSRPRPYHPHVHLLVTAGGLIPDGEAWRKPAHRRLLVPGYCLSPIFRAKMRDGLDAARLSEELDPAVFHKPWAVHLQHAGDGQHAAEYLSRYVHRVALTNERIEAFDGERVTFRYACSRTRETRRLSELLTHEHAALQAARAASQPPSTREPSPRPKRPCPSCRRGHLELVRSWHTPSPELDTVLSTTCRGPPP